METKEHADTCVFLCLHFFAHTKEEIEMLKPFSRPKKVFWPSRSKGYWFRVKKKGDPPNKLYSSITNSCFALVYFDRSRNYGEYYLHTPGSLFGYNFDEELMVLKEDGIWVCHYGGTKFVDEQFSIQGGL